MENKPSPPLAQANGPVRIEKKTIGKQASVARTITGKPIEKPAFNERPVGHGAGDGSTKPASASQNSTPAVVIAHPKIKFRSSKYISMLNPEDVQYLLSDSEDEDSDADPGSPNPMTWSPQGSQADQGFSSIPNSDQQASKYHESRTDSVGSANGSDKQAGFPKREGGYYKHKCGYYDGKECDICDRYFETGKYASKKGRMEEDSTTRAIKRSPSSIEREKERNAAMEAFMKKLESDMGFYK